MAKNWFETTAFIEGFECCNKRSITQRLIEPYNFSPKLTSNGNWKLTEILFKFSILDVWPAPARDRRIDDRNRVLLSQWRGQICEYRKNYQKLFQVFNFVRVKNIKKEVIEPPVRSRNSLMAGAIPTLQENVSGILTLMAENTSDFNHFSILNTIYCMILFII